MRYVYYGLCIVGGLLAFWARWSLPRDVVDFPVKIAVHTNKGPYRWMNHPMYLGTVMMLTGLGGLAAGFWNALAFFTLSELLTREWAWREDR